MDHIIFTDDEEIHDQVRMKFAYLNEKDDKAGLNLREQRRVQKIGQWDKVTDAEWEVRFEDLLQAHLIDVPPGYYDGDLPFSKAS